MSSQVPDSGSWGTHLNRQPKAPGPGRGGRAVPTASAQLYGMRLKANLGAASKVRARLRCHEKLLLELLHSFFIFRSPAGAPQNLKRLLKSRFPPGRSPAKSCPPPSRAL